jgi:hypothetical protein
MLKELQMLLRRGKSPPPDLTAHVAGIREGNEPGGFEKQQGFLPDGRATAARSTGVNAEKRNPIDPRMPNLTPP